MFEDLYYLNSILLNDHISKRLYFTTPKVKKSSIPLKLIWIRKYVGAYYNFFANKNSNMLFQLTVVHILTGSCLAHVVNLCYKSLSDIQLTLNLPTVHRQIISCYQFLFIFLPQRITVVYSIKSIKRGGEELKRVNNSTIHYFYNSRTSYQWKTKTGNVA